MVIAGHDPLRDEGVAYDAGWRPRECHDVRQFDGGIHGFMTMPMLDIAHQARRQACQGLTDLLG